MRRASPRDADDRAGHEAGIVLDAGSVSAWARARDGPLRGSLGLAASTRAAEAAVEVSSHPVLGETVSLAITVPARAARERGAAPGVPPAAP